ncbi:hypothetical protein [Nitrosovibrio sp. Nv6]|uniref:hypothetical protein n=1 Tax=Nitrosovibrio sp. Nv6 TaxID=1855340 RepID=UPI0008B37E67|nr:hypothetical protein [Nitrosovibrio sp. Nv6]SEO41067.1 hypothetical protein SAMN05216316_0152 [Nitrosovibrio sp. Nv6]
MSNIDQPDQAKRPDVRQSPKTLRLTFRVADGTVQLISHERLQMICPPSIGELPQARKHGGFWMELRDKSDHVIFHRLIHSPLAGSVEVHSPDGRIRREFGDVKESIFEVLLPDKPDAASVTLMGESLDVTKVSALQAGSAELARFDIPRGERGSTQ